MNVETASDELYTLFVILVRAIQQTIYGLESVICSQLDVYPPIDLSQSLARVNPFHSDVAVYSFIHPQNSINSTIREGILKLFSNLSAWYRYSTTNPDEPIIEEIEKFFNSPKRFKKFILVQASGFIMEGKSRDVKSEMYQSYIRSHIHNHAMKIEEDFVIPEFYEVVCPENDHLWRVNVGHPIFDFQKLKEYNKVPPLLVASDHHKLIRLLWIYAIIKQINKLENTGCDKIILYTDRASIDHDVFDFIFGGDWEPSFHLFTHTLLDTMINMRMVTGNKVSHMIAKFERVQPWPLLKLKGREFEYKFYKNEQMLRRCARQFYEQRNLLLNCQEHTFISSLFLQKFVPSQPAPVEKLVSRFGSRDETVRDGTFSVMLKLSFLNFMELIKTYKLFDIKFTNNAFNLQHATEDNSLANLLNATLFYRFSVFNFFSFPIVERMYELLRAVSKEYCEGSLPYTYVPRVPLKKIRIIAIDGFIFQGKTTKLKQAKPLIEDLPKNLNVHRVIIHEQDDNWRCYEDHMLKHLQPLLIFSLFESIYTEYMNMDGQDELEIILDRGIVGYCSFQDNVYYWDIFNLFLATIARDVSYYHHVCRDPVINSTFTGNDIIMTYQRRFEKEYYKSKDLTEEQDYYWMKFDNMLQTIQMRTF